MMEERHYNIRCLDWRLREIFEEFLSNIHSEGVIVGSDILMENIIQLVEAVDESSFDEGVKTVKEEVNKCLETY